MVQDWVDGVDRGATEWADCSPTKTLPMLLPLPRFSADWMKPEFLVIEWVLYNIEEIPVETGNRAESIPRVFGSYSVNVVTPL